VDMKTVENLPNKNEIFRAAKSFFRRFADDMREEVEKRLLDCGVPYRYCVELSEVVDFDINIAENRFERKNTVKVLVPDVTDEIAKLAKNAEFLEDDGWGYVKSLKIIVQEDRAFAIYKEDLHI